jgi:hypothetical protein
MNDSAYYALVAFLVIIVICFMWKKNAENAVSASMVKATFAGTLKNKLYDTIPRDDGMTVVDLELENIMQGAM